jgi:tetratricopeptide (TPR) repeat protein
MLSADRKRTLHERAAGALSGKTDPPAASVAVHYERAGKIDPAVDHYRAAVTAAREQYAHELAIEYAEAAVKLVRTTATSVDDEVMAELLSGIGEANALLGQHEAARKYYRYLEKRIDDPQTQQESYYYRAKTHQDCGEYARARELAEAGLVVEAAPDESHVVCRLLAVSGWSSRKQGDIEAALEIHERQRALAERLDDDGLIGRALVSVGITHFRSGDLDAAMELFEQAVECLERADETRQLASAVNEIAGVHRRRGDIQAAKEAFERSLSLMRAVGYQVGVAKLLTNLGLAHDNLGNVDQALEYYEEAIEASERLGDRQNVGVALCNSANLHRHRGDAARARDQFQRGLEISRDLQNDPHLIVFNTP